MLVDRELTEPDSSRPFKTSEQASSLGMLPLVETNDPKAICDFVRWAFEEGVFAYRGLSTVFVEMEVNQDIEKFMDSGDALQEILERDFE